MVSYVNAIGTYVPDDRIDNSDFSMLTGKPESWFLERTGIQCRSRAAQGETSSSMGIEAVRDLISRAGDQVLDDVDLIIGASYTPDDTLSTLASRIQREFEVRDARVYFLSTACSSFVSCLEVAGIMMGAGAARKALIVVAEHNSMYCEDADEMAGHLWGDGAAAAITSRVADAAEYRVDYVRSRGVACAGAGPDAIGLRPAEGRLGLKMAKGRDVFTNACRYMVEEARHGVGQLGLSLPDIDWLVPHQANMRILQRVAESIDLPLQRCVVTLDRLGNTGCASIPISLDAARDRFRPGELVACLTFGGGYSTGVAMLTRC